MNLPQARMRLALAVELTRHLDSLRLLQQCERATGRPFVTGLDVRGAKDAEANFREVS